MGRYYNGDIEGKFWFGVQSSDDGEFFGAVGSEPAYIDYYIDDMEAVTNGINKCLEFLGLNRKRLDDFFNSLKFGYNEEMIAKHWQKKHGIAITEKDIREMLAWYARLELGEKILNCMETQGDCRFQAEL